MSSYEPVSAVLCSKVMDSLKRLLVVLYNFVSSKIEVRIGICMSFQFPKIQMMIFVLFQFRIGHDHGSCWSSVGML